MSLFKKNKSEKTEIVAAVKEESKKYSSSGSLSLVSPHVSERSGILSKIGKYIFKVSRDANKTNIKKSVEQMYKVPVDSVNVLQQHGKKITRGRIQGRRPGFKKAVVTLKKGHQIDIGV